VSASVCVISLIGSALLAAGVAVDIANQTAILVDVIRDKTSDVETLTNLGSDRLKMGIDMDGLVHITDLLTNMYSDEELAVLREYSTNALDAHKQSGQTRPIEVTLPCGTYDLPTEKRPRTLKIQDWGIGLSTEELAEVYSLYGKSTKDDSNEYNGMMGIGGKSGLVSTFGTFTITAIKDGTQTVVHVGRNEASEPVMDLVSVSETEEPNGVTIELPTPKYNGLRRKAQALFQFWPEGTVLVDGRAPDRLEPKLKINDHMWIVEGIETRGGSTDWIVMANVPYPVDMGANLASGYSLVVFVPTGAVSIAPSREALRMTQKTKDEIARLRAEYDQAAKTVMQDAVSKAKNRREAIRVALEWRKTFASNGDFTVKFGNVTLPTWFQVGEVAVKNARKDDKVAGGIIITRYGDDKKSRHDRQEKIFVGTLMDAVLVDGYPVDRVFTSVHKQKLMQWAKDHGIKPAHFVLTEKKIAHGWTDPKYRVKWEEAKKIKRQNAGGNEPYAIRGSYPMHIADRWFNHHPAANIDISNPVFWCDSSLMRIGHGGYRSRSIRELLFERYPNATVVELTNNRINKFKRDFPSARHARTIIDEIYAEIRGSVSLLKLKRFAIEEDGNVGLLRRMDVDRVDDPAIKKAIRWAKTKFDREAVKELNRRLAEIGRYYRSDDMFFEWKNPIDRYPLASVSNIEHTILYINAVYSAEGNN
jgi:hypothetical protein